MTQRVSSIRDLNKYDYSNDIRPYILTSINTNTTQNTISYLGLSNVSSSVSGGLSGIGNLDQLNLTTLTVEEIEADVISTFELTTQFISSFAVKTGNDVTFFGTDDVNFKKFFWDSSENYLHIDGKLDIQDGLIRIHHATDEREIEQDKFDSDLGILFKYYDTDYHGSKFGFFGFDGDNHRFSLKESISILDDRKIIGDGTTQTLLIANLEANEFYVSKISQIENSNTSFDLIAQNGNDINIISGNDLNFYGNNVNFNISSGYQLINTSSNTSFLNTNGSLNLLTVTGDINLDVEHGDIDILIDGNSSNQLILQNTKGDIQILSGSTQNNSILIDTDGGIQIDISTNLTINTNTEILSFDSTNGLTSSVPKLNFMQWISFYKFNTYSGFYFTDRDYTVNLGVTLPKHYWKKEKNNETSLIFTDVELSQNTNSNKGSRLEEIHFGYRVEDANLNNIFVRLTKKTFDNTNQLVIENIPYNDINLTTGITQSSDYYGKIEITNPFFINDTSILNIEVEINTPSTSLFKFYGCNLQFSKNDL